MSADGSNPIRLPLTGKTVRAADLFAGAGGLTEGAEQAGVEVIWAANHWPLAVKVFMANHPRVSVACQDLRQADWTCVPYADLLLAAPACQGHSPARGKDRPHHDALRSTAWAVVDCAECHRNEVIVVENVPAFTGWTLYPSWLDAMRRLGYQVAEHTIDSADHGVPQHRVRLFLVCTRSQAPLQLKLQKRAPVGIGSFIQWEAFEWGLIRRPGRSRHTIERIEAGRAALGDRFVAPYYGNGSGKTGRSIDRPLGTVTTRDRWALIDGDRMRMLQVPEYKAAMGFRPDYVLPSTRADAIHLLGNAVAPPVARDIVQAIRSQA